MENNQFIWTVQLPIVKQNRMQDILGKGVLCKGQSMVCWCDQQVEGDMTVHVVIQMYKDRQPA